MKDKWEESTFISEDIDSFTIKKGPGLRRNLPGMLFKQDGEGVA